MRNGNEQKKEKEKKQFYLAMGRFLLPGPAPFRFIWPNLAAWLTDPRAARLVAMGSLVAGSRMSDSSASPQQTPPMSARASPRLEYLPRSFRAGHIGLFLPLAASFRIPLGIALLAPIKLSRCPIPYNRAQAETQREGT